VKIVIDMNLSPALCGLLAEEGFEALHWSEVGNPRAPDIEIMKWARDRCSVVLTHDLDFGTILATTDADGPSVILVRTEDVRPTNLCPLVVNTVRNHGEILETGALIVIDEGKNRIRILPLSRSDDT